MFNKLIKTFLNRESSYFDLGDRIVVIGDSHARAYAKNINFVPCFLGPGKEFNFISDNGARAILKGSKRIIDLTKPKKILLTFGEPDCRYYCGYGWHPWKEKKVELKENVDALICDSIKRYMKYLSHLSHMVEYLIIQPVPPSEISIQNSIAQKFNALLKKNLQKIENTIYLNDLEDVVWKNNDENRFYFGDHIHMNNEIQPIVERQLLNHGLIEEIQFDQEYKWKNKEIQSKFSLDARFGCYIVK